MTEPLIIGIAGGSGSGKTTLTKRLLAEFGDDISVVYHDNYYKCNDHIPFEERIHINYDHPDAFDTELMVRDLRKLRNGEAVQCPTYDYTRHTRAKETVRIEPAKIILIEGILIFENETLRNMMDLKIFVDADADVRILRRVVRDVKKRGRDLNSVVNQYLTTVKPMHEAFVEPTKKNADIIVPQGGKNEAAVSLIAARMREFLGK